jgi:hypothetical protein
MEFGDPSGERAEFPTGCGPRRSPTSPDKNDRPLGGRWSGAPRVRAAAAVGPRTASPVRWYLVTLFTVPVGATLVVIMFAATTLIIATKGKLRRAKKAVDFMPVSLMRNHD